MFIGVDVRKPQTPPYTSIQKYKLQPKHSTETSPAREVKMVNQSNHRMPGFPHRDELEDSMKVDL